MRLLVAALVVLASAWACLAQEGGPAEKVSTDDTKTAFDVFDYNEDGALSSRELRGAVRELGFPMTKKEDGDGKLTMKELTSILKQYGQMDDEDDYTAEDEGDDEGGV